jgi:alpha-glucosidase
VQWLDAAAGVTGFRGPDGLVCVLNTGADAVALPDGEVLIASADLVDGLLPPDAAAWIR